MKHYCFVQVVFVENECLLSRMLSGSCKFLTVNKHAADVLVLAGRLFGSFLVTCNQVTRGVVIFDDAVVLNSLAPDLVTF